jgi:coproporphyrinogen III oxidase-like Fe-S oxidoreductase
MHPTDDRRFLANETDDPLHEAFDRKMTVHAMPMGRSVRPEELPGLWADAMSAENGLPIRSIYIHIPFCETHCVFCGFYQNAYRSDLAGQYVDALIREMELTAKAPFINAHPFQAVYFGGGTPTALPAESLARLVSTVPRPATLREQADYYVRGIELMQAAHYRRLSITHWARTSRERSLYNFFSRGRSDCVPLGSGAGGWLGDYFFFVEGQLQNYLSAIKAGRKPISFGMRRSEGDFLFRDISYQMELSYCDLKALSKRYDVDLLAILGPIISQWEKVGLVKLTDDCLYLTRSGEFWEVNLAQMLIDRLQGKGGEVIDYVE